MSIFSRTIILCLFCFSSYVLASDEFAETLDLLVDDEIILHTNQKGQNLLHFAVWSRDMATVRFIVEKAPALVRGRDVDGDTPFLYSCMVGSIEIAEFLLSTKQVDINESNNNKATCLHFLANGLHLDIIPSMVEKGADPSLSDGDGDLPAHILLMKLQSRGLFQFYDPEAIDSARKSLSV